MYSVRENAVYWVDIKRPAVYRMDLAGGNFRSSNITNCAFGGTRLDRPFVTSASIALSDEQRSHPPLAGSLFEADPGVGGLAPALFAG